MALYDQIGAGYDTTRRADPGIVRRLVRLLAVPSGTPCLDVACGTGNYTVALSEANLALTGVDVSQQMLTSARAKPSTVRWVNGDVTALPFARDAFGAAVCTMALHHFRQPEQAFREIGRVLGDGRLVFFTADRQQMRRYWLNEYFPRAMERATRQMPPVEQSVRQLAAAGFGRVRLEPWTVTEDVQDWFLYALKYRPALYLDPRVRAGISTFANLASPDEVAQGCARLADDLDTGRFARVLQASEHDGGDYLFLVAERG
ncbi:MAG: methyltransferase domain-containing protein [Chloroflexi bacterium]|nr:methyltransferase domain-containing protein [Chloroflexota bacterium]